MIAGALLLSAALQGPPPPGPRGKADVWLACGAMVGDLATTEWAVSRGGVEANPLVKNRGVRLGLGAVQCGGLHLLEKDYPKAAKVAARVTWIARGVAIVWNILKLRSYKQSEGRQANARSR